MRGEVEFEAMTTSKIILLSLAFAFTHGALFSQQPEHESLSIVLQTDKKTYYPFESIVLTTEFKNVSKEIQYFEWIHIFRAPIRYRLIGKKKEFNIYDAFLHSTYGPGRPMSKETEIKPGESIRETFVINKYFDLRNYLGPLTIEVGYPIYKFIEGEGQILTDKFKINSIEVEIKTEPKSESIPIKLLAESLPILLSRDAFSKIIFENLERIINEHPTSYIIDQAYYFLSVYYYQMYEYYKKPEQLEASKKYIT